MNEKKNEYCELEILEKSNKNPIHTAQSLQQKFNLVLLLL